MNKQGKDKEKEGGRGGAHHGSCYAI